MMKTAYLSIFAVALLALSGAMVLFAEDSDAAETDKVTIKFDTKGGSALESMKVDKGTFFFDIVYTIASPTKDDNTFDGWYIDSDYKHAMGYNVQLNKDITLYAKWMPNDNFKVLFIDITDDSMTVVDSQNVKVNEKASKPSDPVRSGYRFVGWYISELNTETGDYDYVKYDFSKKITEDTELFAAWEAKDGGVIDGLIDFAIENVVTVILILVAIVMFASFAYSVIPLFLIYGIIAAISALLSFIHIF